MWPRFGIKIGNSTLCIAYARADGKAEVIANKQGDRTSQACLLWDGANEIECGLTARQKMALRPTQAVANSFQLLLPPEELSDELRAHIPSSYDVETQRFQLHCQARDPEANSAPEVHELSAYEVHVRLLRAELELARQYYSSAEQQPLVVLSIPSYYPNAAWPLLAQAAEEAGFSVSQVIAEPTAAVLAYSLGELAKESKYVLTIKSGGLYSHFAFYELQQGLYLQMAAYGPFSIGGQNYTEALVRFICEEFQRKYKLDPQESRRSLAKIRTAASNCKHILSTLPATQIYIDSLMDGVDFNAQMSRARFESLIQPVMSSFMQTLGECVEKAGAPRIDSIVLLGATMQIPKLQAAIAARFPEAQLHTALASDEVVAVGCARHAAALEQPRAQELEARAQLVCAAEQVLIWHGEDESRAQVLLDKGAVLPQRVRLEVQSCGSEPLFRLRAGANTNEICLQNAQANEQQLFRLEADIACQPDDNEQPLIRLRCL